MSLLLTRRPAWVARVAGVVCAAMASAAVAELPPAVDHVPPEALVVASVPSLSELKASMTLVTAALNLPEDPEGMAEINELMAHPGVNPNGSAALAILPHGEEESHEPPMVAIFPVSDFGAFVEGFGGQAAEGIATLTIHDQQLFAKSLEGGFLAMSDRRELVDGLATPTGAGAAFERMLGEAGSRAADGAGIVVVANLAAMAPMLKEKFDEQKQQMAMFVPPEQQGQIEVMDAMVQTFLRDVQAGVLGVSAAEAGLSFTAAAQFKEGSELASRFNAAGESAGLLQRIPDMPYYFAWAFDTTAPGIKALTRQMAQMSAAADPQGAEAMGLTGTLLDAIDTIDGLALVMGTSPGLMGGGLFLNSLEFIKTSEPATFLGALEATMTKMDEKAVQGVTYDTSFEREAHVVAGQTVSTWSMRMRFDPTDPAAQQAQAMQTMLFGPTGGLGGFAAPTDDGVIVTFGRNTRLLQDAIKAATARQGLGGNATLRQVQAHLPEGRVFEGYIGTQSILDTALGFVAMMMPGGLGEFEPPLDLPPIGVGGSMPSGGVYAKAFLPMPVIQTFKSLGEAIENAQQGGMQGQEGEDEEDAGRPRF